MSLSEIKSYAVVLSFYIKMMKRRTLQACNLKDSIKKKHIFCLGQTELKLDRMAVLPPSYPTPSSTNPLGYASVSVDLWVLKMLMFS